ncbi:MAG: PLP-dependent aminotransferase family protein [Clostridiales Family XIII bacterium]|jgi:GntR family transcriptional regulator/MocR family aminotransferase|nr:PLP-dependent aminotransferase family protein [Clostridiales Family XIII bacterium]
MINISIDYDDKRPYFEQVYYGIRNIIENGELSTNARLPSKRALATHLKISQGTVEKAYGQLLAEGYLFSIERSGYFVSSTFFDNENANEVRRDWNLPDNSGHIMTYTQTYNAAKNYDYDLRIGDVDESFFPYSIWNRLQRQIISSKKEGLLKSSEYKGNEELRNQLAEHLRQHRGIVVDPECIILGAGMEYLMSLLSDILGIATFACEDPGNYIMHELLKLQRRKVVPVPIDKDGIIIETLAKSGAGAVLVKPSHHFPLGNVMSIDRKKEILSWAKDDHHHKRYIIEDDFDYEFRYSLRPMPTLKSMDEDDCVIYMNSFTRTIAPSLRLAYMILPYDVMDRYETAFEVFSSSVSEFEQRTLNLFIEGGYYERHINRMRKEYKKKRECLVQVLNYADYNSAPKHLNYHVGMPKAGLSLFLSSNRYTEDELVRRAADVGVRVYPISKYYFDTKPKQPAVLLGYAGYSEDDLRDAGVLLRTAWAD